MCLAQGPQRSDAGEARTIQVVYDLAGLQVAFDEKVENISGNK